MHRGTRSALTAVALVLVVGVGVAVANRSERAPEAPADVAASHEPEAEGSPDPAAVSHAAERLAASGIDVEEAVIDDLAATYGVGGAVRLAAWADASGRDVDDLRSMRDGGAGWGQMARELGLHPGIGSIMGHGSGVGGEHPGPPERTPDD